MHQPAACAHDGPAPWPGAKSLRRGGSGWAAQARRAQSCERKRLRPTTTLWHAVAGGTNPRNSPRPRLDLTCALRRPLWKPPPQVKRVHSCERKRRWPTTTLWHAVARNSPRPRLDLTCALRQSMRKPLPHKASTSSKTATATASRSLSKACRSLSSHPQSPQSSQGAPSQPPRSPKVQATPKP